MPINQKEIRPLLRSWIEEGFAASADPWWLHTVEFQQLDTLVITPSGIIGVEIKGETDALHKLTQTIKKEKRERWRWDYSEHGRPVRVELEPVTFNRQVECQIEKYEAICDMCFVCAHTKHLPKLLGMLPHHWGIIVVDESGLRLERGPCPNPNLTALGRANLLWAKEQSVFLRGRGNKVGARLTGSARTRAVLEHAQQLIELTPSILYERFSTGAGKWELPEHYIMTRASAAST